MKIVPLNLIDSNLISIFKKVRYGSSIFLAVVIALGAVPLIAGADDPNPKIYGVGIFSKLKAWVCQAKFG
jgi:hypothetical protein